AWGSLAGALVRRYAVRYAVDLVAEVAGPSHKHRRTGGIDGGHDFGVTDRATRLDEAHDAGGEADLDRIRKREERIRGTGRAAHRVLAADRTGLVDRLPRGVDPRRLPPPEAH